MCHGLCAIYKPKHIIPPILHSCCTASEWVLKEARSHTHKYEWVVVGLFPCPAISHRHTARRTQTQPFIVLMSENELIQDSGVELTSSGIFGMFYLMSRLVSGGPGVFAEWRFGVPPRRASQLIADTAVTSGEIGQSIIRGHTGHPPNATVSGWAIST